MHKVEQFFSKHWWKMFLGIAILVVAIDAITIFSGGNSLDNSIIIRDCGRVAGYCCDGCSSMVLIPVNLVLCVMLLVATLIVIVFGSISSPKKKRLKIIILGILLMVIISCFTIVIATPGTADFLNLYYSLISVLFTI